MKKREESQLDALLAPLKAMSTVEQLKFWRTFRAKHWRRMGKAEATFCPELMRAVDAHIKELCHHLSGECHG